MGGNFPFLIYGRVYSKESFLGCEKMINDRISKERIENLSNNDTLSQKCNWARLWIRGLM
ncbi:MAG: hypothetical protein DRN12_04715 [Thermoplasmata archaeon]|nr:MAG: hypothetical protein DRN12_04715 [Thermoplasmata archaeon]